MDYPGGLEAYIDDYINSVTNEQITHRGLEMENTTDGRSYTFRFVGTRSAMLALAEKYSPKTWLAFGRLTSIDVTQDAGPVWQCQLVFQTHDEGNVTSPPDTSYGKKSARLSVSMLSNDLNLRPNYRTNWNHYLFAAPGTTDIPDWWATATTLTISASDAQKYKWVSASDAVPMTDGKNWHIIKNPTKPGVSRYDTAVYTVVESARFRSASAAGRMAVGKLNKIGSPDETFGITGGNWKCDGAEVSWSGKFWLATLTWTHSATNQGWDEDLYQES